MSGRTARWLPSKKAGYPKAFGPVNILKIEKDGTIRLDAEEELRRREMIFRMQESLFENSDEESI